MNFEILLEILEELERHGGAARDLEIYRVLRKRYDISTKEFYKALMILELRGLIYVETIKKNERLVQLLMKKNKL
ncbi:MAG: hypothetical protein DRJ51_06555 [Thermoprotei archaeon]|nr:MAG: hypothetical protein DRJ36_04045 [Thermoprotei archaeon]RLE80063.1 MAG: hypothetical protein DRJ51_06555 [Thermoprotei archaeon]RLF03198.1 MAG: hypothetical protein DRJ59_01355 [Thermoprotei archaeon]